MASRVPGSDLRHGVCWLTQSKGKPHADATVAFRVGDPPTEPGKRASPAARFPGPAFHLTSKPNNRFLPYARPPLVEAWQPLSVGVALMRALDLHRWDISPAEAADLQRQLRSRLVLEDALGHLRLVAGADVALDRRGKVGFGGVVIFSFPELELVEFATAVRPLPFPYVPGLLAFREAPVLLAAFERLRETPDLLVLDAHGYAHPRRLGLASHLGLVLETPSVGCAKSVLVGHYEEPDQERGSWTPLVDKGETIGAALRTRSRVKPVFVSVGHRVSLPTAVRLMLACSSGFRVPLPTREADKLVGRLKRGEISGREAQQGG